MNRTVLIRKLIPLVVRQEIKHFFRIFRDLKNKNHFSKSYSQFTENNPIYIIQPILKTAFYENKLINIKRGADLLSFTTIESNQSWSFWHRMDRPKTKNGFAVGRNLVDGKLMAQVGGGLCQLSSLIYHLALVSGLKIVERYPHSIDIYEEHQRFTPLGADAAVVWGFKDLRLYNPHPFPIIFQFKILNGILIGEAHASCKLPTYQVEFNREIVNQGIHKVTTTVNHEVVACDIYVHKVMVVKNEDQLE